MSFPRKRESSYLRQLLWTPAFAGVTIGLCTIAILLQTMANHNDKDKEATIQFLPEHEAVDQIVETVQQAEEGKAPFALVLGSGFSQGLVPTTRELVTDSLPLWMKCLKDGQPFESYKDLPDAQRLDVSRIFWKDFVERNANRKLDLPFDPQTGLPLDFVAAYKAAFDHRLYWCGLESDPRAKGAFGERVSEVLCKPTALYIQTAGAGQFMAQLCRGLVDGLPRLLDNPIGQLREMLGTIDLSELKLSTVSNSSDATQFLGGGPDAAIFHQKQQETLQRLEYAEQIFLGQAMPQAVKEITETKPSKQTPRKWREGSAVTTPPPGSKSQVLRLLSSAKMANALGNYVESLKLCNEALGLPALEVSDQTELLLVRGLVHYFLGHTDDAVADWTQIIELPDTPVAPVAWALLNRGVVWDQKDDLDKALSDYTRVIESLPNAPVGSVAKAFVFRGVTWDRKGELDRAMSDYTHVIKDLPGSPAELVAGAFVNRGWTHYRKGDLAGFLADTRAALNRQPSLRIAAFRLGLALLANGHDSDALAAYHDAGRQFPAETETFGLPELLEAQKKWLTPERAQPVIQLLQSLKK